jgi:hypothetical protein
MAQSLKAWALMWEAWLAMRTATIRSHDYLPEAEKESDPFL